MYYKEKLKALTPIDLLYCMHIHKKAFDKHVIEDMQYEFTPSIADMIVAGLNEFLTDYKDGLVVEGYTEFDGDSMYETSITIQYEEEIPMLFTVTTNYDTYLELAKVVTGKILELANKKVVDVIRFKDEVVNLKEALQRDLTEQEVRNILDFIEPYDIGGEVIKLIDAAVNKKETVQETAHE